MECVCTHIQYIFFLKRGTCSKAGENTTITTNTGTPKKI